jgi:hypothetical protein
MTEEEIAKHQKAMECKAVTHVIELIKSLKFFTKSEALLMIIKMMLDIQYIDLATHTNQTSCDQCIYIAEINMYISLLQYNAFYTMINCNNFSSFLVNEALEHTSKHDTIDKLMFHFVINMKQLQINYAKSIIKNNEEIMVTNKQIKDIENIILEELDHPNYQPMIVNMCSYLEIDPKTGISQFPQLVNKLDDYHHGYMNDKVSELSVQIKFLKRKFKEHYSTVPFSLLFHVKAIELVFDKFLQKYF